MTAESLHKIGFGQIAQYIIGGRCQCGMVLERPPSYHFASPCRGTAARQNLRRSRVHGGFVPMRENLIHAVSPRAIRRFKNSATRLPATAARYFAVDRISSIGRTSAAAVFLARTISDSSIAFLLNRDSVSRNRRGTGATLPIAIRTPSIFESDTRPSAAMQTLEIA